MLVLDRYRFRGKELLASFFFTSLIVPVVVLGFSLPMFIAMLGIYDGSAHLVGGHIIVTIPHTIRTTFAGLVGIRKSLVEAAQSLGANERQAFWSIAFPRAKTGMVAGSPTLDAFAIAKGLEERGWLPNAFTSPDSIHVRFAPAHEQAVGKFVADFEAVVDATKRGALKGEGRTRTYTG